MLRCLALLLALCASAACHPQSTHAKLRHRLGVKAAQVEHWRKYQGDFEETTTAENLQKFHDVSFFFPEVTWESRLDTDSIVAKRLANKISSFALDGVHNSLGKKSDGWLLSPLTIKFAGDRYELRFGYESLSIKPEMLHKYLTKNPKKLRGVLEKDSQLEAYATKIKWNPHYAVHAFSVENLRWPKHFDVLSLGQIVPRFSQELGQAKYAKFLTYTTLVGVAPLRLSPEERDFFVEFSSTLKESISSGRLTNDEVYAMMATTSNRENVLILEFLETVAQPTAENARQLLAKFGRESVNDLNLPFSVHDRLERLVHGCTKENSDRLKNICVSEGKALPRGLADIDDKEEKYFARGYVTWREEYAQLATFIKFGAAENLNEVFGSKLDLVLWQVERTVYRA